jgi:hypothetical protein
MAVLLLTYFNRSAKLIQKAIKTKSNQDKNTNKNDVPY